MKKVKRPRHYFSPNSEAPDYVTVRISIPSCFEHFGVEGWQSLVADAVRAREEELHAELAAEGKTFKGLKGIRKIRSTQSATSTGKADHPAERWAGSEERCKERKQQYADFVEAYYACCNRFERGVRCEFPLGTWGMKVRWGVPCVGDMPDEGRSPPDPKRIAA